MSTDSRDVQLTVPARPGYLVLARLALSAICRLTPLQTAEIADLKLAVTEAASRFMTDDPEDGQSLMLDFRLEDDRLELGLEGVPVDAPEEEQELSRAIVAATVDHYEIDRGRTLLVKRLAT